MRPTMMHVPQFPRVSLLYPVSFSTLVISNRKHLAATAATYTPSSPLQRPRWTCYLRLLTLPLRGLPAFEITKATAQMSSFRRLLQPTHPQIHVAYYELPSYFERFYGCPFRSTHATGPITRIIQLRRATVNPSGHPIRQPPTSGYV
jgi:hypothetical protein